MNPTEADMDAAVSLWSREARAARGCTCFAAADAEGHTDRHESWCGDVRPDDVAVLIARAREEERARIIAWLRAQRDSTYEPPIPVRELQYAADYIVYNEHVTSNMEDALENIAGGVARWSP